MTANAPTGSQPKDFYGKEMAAFSTRLLNGIMVLISMAVCDRGMWKPNLKQFKRLCCPPYTCKARKNPDMEKDDRQMM